MSIPPFPSFKDQVALDAAVFTNPQEFGGEHTIDGRQLVAVVEDTINDKTPLDYAEGVFVVRKTVHVARVELGYLPEVGQWMLLNGLRMQVTKAADEFGMIVIELEANVT
ncbi:hypothetical protein [Paenibacillus contaminans]|uniref:Uncharacterized protein n=1 Tax=Paenibacillus contaminans TaxID=450362 RepID=A0A329MHI5_9BACL|nr:hypothetical protein [Paenibacillus contaminans]RAV18826.1 hypothetical protein DQG23_24155 [Paenibacillus contaminans]